MNPRIDLVGRRFERLIVVGLDRRNGKSVWVCECDCGNSATALTNQLVASRVRSCGCLRADAAVRAGAANVTHGKTQTRAFSIWRGMRQRCTSEKAINFDNYGGRGITVCDRWNRSFQAFIDDMGDPGNGMQLDRIDTDGNYEPENCRWVTPSQNSRNRRNNNLIELNGITRTITEWAECIGVTRQALHRRLHVLGWPKEKALTCEKTR